MEHQLLIETIDGNDAQMIAEAAADGKNTWLSGIFMQAEVKNRNGRVYPLKEINRAVESANTTIKNQNGIFGELDHPQSLTINLDRISHVITEMSMNGNNAVGKAKLLETPNGKIAKELVKSGVKLGVSSRGAGAVDGTGGVSDFNFITVDIVATPSAEGATPSAVYESMMASKNGREAITLAEEMKNDPAAQKYFKKAIMAFLNENLFAKK